ncbi:MAG: hypothetical protein ABI649_07930 [Gaiellaceae bacterium]
MEPAPFSFPHGMSTEDTEDSGAVPQRHFTRRFDGNFFGAFTPPRGSAQESHLTVVVGSNLERFHLTEVGNSDSTCSFTAEAVVSPA